MYKYSKIGQAIKTWIDILKISIDKIYQDKVDLSIYKGRFFNVHFCKFTVGKYCIYSGRIWMQLNEKII